MTRKLKVLLVCNNAYVKGNGLCTAVQSTLSRLRDCGIDAKLMAAENADDGEQPDFPLKHFKFPIFEPIVYANGFRYAKADKEKLKEAISWADVVHVLEAFPLEVKVVNLSKVLGKPVVGTFHLFPENITANLGIASITWLNSIILKIWRNYVFNKCTLVQCPTENVKNHLLKHNFTSELRVISNGIDIPEDFRLNASVKHQEPIKILCVGRLSNEKSQDTLLKSMCYSRHAEEIQLEFAGKGPKAKKYKRMARRLYDKGILKYAPKFNFYEKDDLKNLINESYLYIHCAWIEVEGLSCIEAVRYGIVPIIARGKLTSTSQFALNDYSLFDVFDSKTLASRIDWWIEHPEDYAKMRVEYLNSVAKYDQRDTTQKLIEMYIDAIKK